MAFDHPLYIVKNLAIGGRDTKRPSAVSVYRASQERAAL